MQATPIIKFSVEMSSLDLAFAGGLLLAVYVIHSVIRGINGYKE